MPTDQLIVLQGMAVYYLLFLVGALIGQSLLNLVGAMLFMSFMGVMRFRKLIDPLLDGPCLATICFLGLAILSTALNLEHTDPIYLVKLCASILFFLVLSSLQLRPLHATAVRTRFIWLPLGLVAFSLATGRSAEVLGDTRVTGLFVNPNNLALIGLCLLFFIDERQDSRATRIGLHLLTIAIVILSGTLGALMAYLAGLGLRVARTIPRRQFISVACLLLALAPLAGYTLLLLKPHTADDPNLLERMVNSLVLVRDYFAPAVQGEAINFYRLGKIYGESCTSALWRLALWSEALRLLLTSDPTRLLLGFGVGSTSVYLDTLMHNDYLRLLFETGLAGFSLGLGLLWAIFKRIPREKQYCAAIVLCYGVTENIIDNLVFVTLFLLFLVAGHSLGPQMRTLSLRPIQPSGTPAWRYWSGL